MTINRNGTTMRFSQTGLLAGLLTSFLVLAAFTGAGATEAKDTAATKDIEFLKVATRDIIVIDGDTLDARGKIINLVGIDAPEMGQLCNHNGHFWSCGITAAFELQKAITMSKTAELHCRLHRTINDYTFDAACFLGKKNVALPTGKKEDLAEFYAGKDLSATMLQFGMAIIKPKTSIAYKELQFFAQNAALGLWSSAFVEPAQWTKGQRLEGEKTECAFRGFADKKGQRYFVGPLDKDYDKYKGAKAIFCSDDLADKAGYRHFHS